MAIQPSDIAFGCIADADGKPRGYFNIGDRTAHAVIPATKP